MIQKSGVKNGLRIKKLYLKEKDTIAITIGFGFGNIMGKKLLGHIVTLIQKVDKPVKNII